MSAAGVHGSFEPKCARSRHPAATTVDRCGDRAAPGFAAPCRRTHGHRTDRGGRLQHVVATHTEADTERGDVVVDHEAIGGAAMSSICCVSSRSLRGRGDSTDAARLRLGANGSTHRPRARASPFAGPCPRTVAGNRNVRCNTSPRRADRRAALHGMTSRPSTKWADSTMMMWTALRVPSGKATTTSRHSRRSDRGSTTPRRATVRPDARPRSPDPSTRRDRETRASPWAACRSARRRAGDRLGSRGILLSSRSRAGATNRDRARGQVQKRRPRADRGSSRCGRAM